MPEFTSTLGYQNLRSYFPMNDYDVWGRTLAFHFAIAEVLTHAGDGDVPAHWEFRDSPLHESEDDLAESSPDSELLELFRDGHTTSDDLRSFGNVLFRYANLLRAAGKDY